MDAGLAHLTGPDAQGLLAEQLGTETLDWRVRSVDHRPGSGTTVAYDVTVPGREGPERQLLAASTGAAGTQVWRFPLDPELPALRTATDEAAVRDLLASFGIGCDAVRLDVRSYRPRRRAVVEVRAPGCRLFLKVLRPSAVQGVHERHVLLRDAGLPVPRSLGWSERGLLVLEALGGRSLRTVLREGGAAPEVTAVVKLLDRLPEQVCALPRRPSWTDSVEHYASVTADVLPAEAARCAQLAERVRQRTAGRPADAPAHGDLHEAQLLVSGGSITGLIDVDTVGPGRRLDDIACLLGHLEVLAQEQAAPARELLGRWRRRLERDLDADELRARVAGVLVSLATGPHRVRAERWPEQTVVRLDLAERWLS